MQTDSILSNIGKHIVLDQSERDYLLGLLKEKELKKKDCLLKEGELCTTFNYVNSGALRAFYRDQATKEVTIMFAVAHWWITDMPCFVSQSPAMINIEAIANSSVLQLEKKDMDQLLVDIPKFERFFRIIMQNAYVREQLRVLQTLSMPADIRYYKFLEKYPQIVQQVPLKHIASYLGITPEFLSNIRKIKR